MREKYESLALADLKAIARTRGIRGTSVMKKAEVVEAMLALDEQEKKEAVPPADEETGKKAAAGLNTLSKRGLEQEEERGQKEGEEEERRKRPGEDKFPAELDSGITASGILEVMQDGFGFIRCGLCGLPVQGCRYKLYPPIKPRYQKASGGGERARAGRGQHELF